MRGLVLNFSLIVICCCCSTTVAFMPCPSPARTAQALWMGVRGTEDEIMAILGRKKLEVRGLVQEHSALDDPLQRRLSYAADESTFRLRRALRREQDIDAPHKLAVLADIKRRSPTSSTLPHDIASFEDIKPVAAQARDWGCDAVMINTDRFAYGGDVGELEQAVKAVRYEGAASKDPAPGPPVIMKDFIIHPLQMALGLEKGAAGCILSAAILGPALEDFMNTATTMGTEAIVEVHTPAECAKALEYGATVIMFNNWDRITGKLYPNQALAMQNMLPPMVLSIAAGGISTVEQTSRLADEGVDAVVLGRALALADRPDALVAEIRARVGLPRNMLGMGIGPTDLGFG
ncbi:unnamed protein product [Chrysoparadoxa australica]